MPLSRDDAQLAARDPELPALATMLDPDALLGELTEARPDLQLEEMRATYARWKPGRRALVGYSASSGGRETSLFARAWRTSSYTRRVDALGGVTSRRVLLPELSASVDLFPGDPELPALAELADPRARRRLLAELLPERCDLWGANLHLLRYWPEQRFVARLEAEGGSRALVKVHRPRDWPQAGLNARSFEAMGRLRVPKLLAACERRRLLILEWLPGRRLDELIAESAGVPGALAAVGASLAMLHGSPADALRSYSPRDRAESLLRRSQWMEAACPELGPVTSRLAGRLGDALTALPAAQAAVHGDFSPQQVLVDGTHVSIIDFDGAHRGDPAADFGTLIANLERRAAIGKLARARADELVEALLDGYRGAAIVEPPSRDRIRVRTAAALFGRAPNDFRRRKPDWVARMRGLVERASEMLY